MKLQKLGGVASIALVFANIAAMGILIVAFQGFTGSADFFDPAQMIAAYQNSPVSFLMYYIVEICVALLTLLVALALQEWMQTNAPHLMRMVIIAASVYFGLLITREISGVFRNVLLAETKDLSAFRAFLFLHECLGNAAFHSWGWGLLLIGWVALRTHALPRILGFIIIGYGIVGIIQFAFTISPFLSLGSGIWFLFGLVVFLWLGVVLLRKPNPIPAQA